MQNFHDLVSCTLVMVAWKKKKSCHDHVSLGKAELHKVE